MTPSQHPKDHGNREKVFSNERNSRKREEAKMNLEVLSHLFQVILVLPLASWPYFADACGRVAWL